MKRFVYLIQARAHMPYDCLPDPGNDIILLTWGTPSDFPGAIHFPRSSWNEGRNRLLAEALRRGRERGENYLYFIFLDEDVELKEDTELAESLGISLTGNPFRTFESLLLEWEPAVGYARYSWQFTEPDRPVNPGHNFDALFNAFHREAVEILLPYYTGFDAESWLYSQLLISHLCSLIYPFHRMQLNVILARNNSRKGYAQRKRYWGIPSTFLRNSIRSGLGAQMNLTEPNTPFPSSGVCRKKTGRYDISPERLEMDFDRHHPFWAGRKDELICIDNPLNGPHRRFAVCMSGSCRGLEKTWKNIRHNLLDCLPEYDLFILSPDDGHGEKAMLLHPTVAFVEADQGISETGLINGCNCMLKTGIQRYLQQLNGLKRVNHLRKEFSRKTGKEYDAVIRCRPDVWYTNPVTDLSTLDLRYLYCPDFHLFDGINDRFAVGKPADMDIYMNKLDEFHGYVRDWKGQNPYAPPVSAEMFTSGHLRNHGIRVRTIPVRFNRVRDHGIKQDVCGTIG